MGQNGKQAVHIVTPEASGPFYRRFWNWDDPADVPQVKHDLVPLHQVDIGSRSAGLTLGQPVPGGVTTIPTEGYGREPSVAHVASS